MKIPLESGVEGKWLKAGADVRDGDRLKMLDAGQVIEGKFGEQYVFKFPEIANSPPDFNLEGFMNWHPGAWNTRKFTVAEGDGLFKHCDANNFGQ